MRFSTVIVLIIFSLSNAFANESVDKEKEIFLGINTADVREDTSSVQFLNLFSSAIPFNETVPWGSKKEVTYDENGWPNNLNGGQAGTKFLNRLPEDTVEDGFFTVLYDGEGEIFYGNDARLVVHRPNKDIIEIRAGKDKILNASLFIKKSNPDNYIRNIRIVPEGGVCKGTAHIRVKSPKDCAGVEYLSFEDNHLNPWAKEQREKLAEENKKKVDEADENKTTSDTKADQEKVVEKEQSEKTEKVTKKVEEKTEEDDKTKTKINTESKSEEVVETKEESPKKDKDESKESDVKDTEKGENEEIDKDAFVIKGYSDPEKALVFNPDYLDFMKDFQMVRFMNMSGMTRNPVEKWDDRNTLKKATWGGKYGSRGAPVEIMVALSNQIDAYPWFSMPYKANDDYIKDFGKYVHENLKPKLKAYIEYSNEVWNPIFIHHDYAIQQGMKEKLDPKKSQAGYKWYSKRSVQTFKIWEDVFAGNDRLIRVMGSWASNQIMSSTVLKYEDAYKHTDALAIGPYFSAHPRVLRRAETVDDVFKAMLDKKTKWGMQSTINYIKKQAKVAKSFGVDLIAYEGGQHLVDWNTRKVDEHPNELLYAANRDPRMGILYDELMNEWQRAGGKLFVAFSAPRIYSWYGSWGIKEYIRQARSDAPKYDSLLRYLNKRLYPKQLPQPGINPKDLEEMAGTVKNIKIAYAKTPQMIWDMSHQQQIKTGLVDNSASDIDAHWQANWDSKNLYLSFAINDDDLAQGDEIKLTLDTTTEAQNLVKEEQQKKQDIANEKALLEKQGKEKAARKLEYERIAREKKAKEEALTEAKKPEDDKDKKDKKEKSAEIETDTKVKEDKEENQAKASDSKDEVIKNKNDAQQKKVVDTKNKEQKKSSIKEEEQEEDVTKPIVSSSKTTVKENKEETVVTKDAEKPEETTEKTKTAKIITTTIKNKTDEDKKSETEKTVSKPEQELESEEQDKQNQDQKELEAGLQKSSEGNVITFTFTPFDKLNKYSRITASDSGYLINVAIPWSEIYHQQDAAQIQMKSGDRLGINVIVNDYDKDEKGNKELISADTSLPLPKLILKNILFE